MAKVAASKERFILQCIYFAIMWEALSADDKSHPWQEKSNFGSHPWQEKSHFGRGKHLGNNCENVFFLIGQ